MKAPAWLVGTVVAGGLGIARAEHEDTIPRAVVERQIGPLLYGEALPEAFRACRPRDGGEPTEEYRAFFSSPSLPTTGVALLVNVDCLDRDRNVVSCAPPARRFVKGLHLETGAHVYKPEALAPRCPLTIAPPSLTTSRGIGLGASYKAVLAAYGPPSLKASAHRGDEVYVLYTKGRDAAETDALQFRFARDTVYAIDLSYGEGEKQWK